MSISVERHDPPKVKQPPTTYTITHTEGHGTWELTETEAIQLFRELRHLLPEEVTDW